MDVCYVCCDDSYAPPSACGCRDRRLHLACQMRMVQFAWTDSCTVCKQRFSNMSVRKSWRLRPSPMGAALLFYVATEAVAGTLSAVVLRIPMRRDMYDIFYPFCMGGMGCVAMFMLATVVQSVWHALPLWTWYVRRARVDFHPTALEVIHRV